MMGYLHAEFHKPLSGFVDDVELPDRGQGISTEKKHRGHCAE